MLEKLKGFIQGSEKLNSSISQLRRVFQYRLNLVTSDKVIDFDDKFASLRSFYGNEGLCLNDLLEFLIREWRDEVMNDNDRCRFDDFYLPYLLGGMDRLNDSVVDLLLMYELSGVFDDKDFLKYFTRFEVSLEGASNNEKDFVVNFLSEKNDIKELRMKARFMDSDFESSIWNVLPTDCLEVLAVDSFKMSNVLLGLDCKNCISFSMTSVRNLFDENFSSDRLGEFSKVRDLNLSLSGLESENVSDLISILRVMPELVKLDLSKNMIGDENLLELNRYILSSKIREVNLRKNAITEEGRFSLERLGGEIDYVFE